MSESSSSSSDSREQLPLSNQEQEVGLESSQVPLILPIDEPAENRAVEPVQKKNYKVYVNEPVQVEDTVEVSSNKKHRKSCLRCLQKFKIVPRVKKNAIRTSRYTGVNYFPWVLARQFRRPANVFFLAVMIITFTPVSPLDPVTWTAFFLLVLLASVLKEGIEDIIRHQNDKKVNHRPVSAWRNGEEIRTRWAKLIPGDILKMRDGDEIPADLVVLSTSQKNGQCYVSTVNLDGESALKTRQAVKTTHPYSEENLVSTKMTLSADDPSPLLTTFSGYIQVSDPEQRNETSPVDLNNMLFRGTVLKNTEYVYGVLVYAGKNTKYSLNSKLGASKRSTVEQSYDKYIIGNLIALIVVAVAYAVYSSIFQERNLADHWYLPRVTDVPVFGVSIFFTYVALLAVFIPLPLYVTLEVVRAGQFRIFGWENYLYDAKKDFRPVSRSLNLHEDLGQIQYIFSDKTGTLTKNKMILQSLDIGTDSFANNKKLPNLEVDAEWKSIAPIRNQRFEWNDESLVKRLKALSISNNYERDPLYISLLTIALCHSANVFDKNVDENTDIVFHSNSPDEKALLEAAQNFGFCFMARDFDTVKLNVFGKPALFTVLHTLEFSGERKRMSVIMQDDSGRIMLLTKGADAVVLARTAKDQPLVSADIAQHQADKMGNECLRTLVLAYKELSREQYNDWYNTYWKPSIEDYANRQSIVDKASEIIETDLQILGVTGVEDELQDNVPLTISRLLHAGIKIWVVTGDKQETAFNIAVACNLVHESSTVFLHVKSNEEKGNIATTLDKINALRQESPESEGTIDLLEHSEWMENRASIKRVGLVLDGETLEFCLEHHWKEILPLMTQCDSVLVCRASPLQKEKVVKNVKKYDKEAVALAIGDGGNDVSMLHAADVGIGLPGEEGSQALMAADFQIGQFELLDDLVLVKGRYFYLQMCIFMFYFCYKSLVAIICRFLYVPFAAWSGTSFLNDLVGSFYQLLFTSVPIILSGIFEEDISPSWLLKYPQLYKECVKKIYFNIRIYLFWMALAIYQGVVCWGVAILTYNEAASIDGKYPGLLGESTVNISYVVVVANLQLARILKRWVYPHHIALYGSIVVYVIVTIISSLFRSSALHLIGQWMFAQPTFYLGLIVCVVACLLPEVLLTYIQRNYYPRLSDIVAEKEVVHRHRTKEADELGGGWTELTKRSGSITKLDKM